MFAATYRTVFRALSLLENSNQRFLSSVYASKLSLDNLYPKRKREESSKVQQEQSNATETDVERFSGAIPLDRLNIHYCRSGGAGGQNVNKVNTKVQVKFNIDGAEWIPDWIKPKIKEQQPNRVTKDGDLIMTSEKTRKQILNQADCLEKIRHIIFQASTLPKELTPEQKELIKKRERAANEKRLQDKKRRSLIKRIRRMDTL